MAVDSILDRTFGKAIQTTELTGKDGKDLDGGTKEEIEKLSTKFDDFLKNHA